MLLIVATVLPVAGTNEDNEEENYAHSSGMQPIPTWGFHSKYYYNGYPVNGCLIVWGTYNCKRLCPALFMGYIYHCVKYSGPIPPSITYPDGTVRPVNDVRYEFAWDASCHNYNSWKYTAPSFGPTGWVLEPIGNFIIEHLDEPIYLPNIGLCDPPGFIYTVVDAYAALEEPLIQDEYIIENGTCDELPGYLIGTTPIMFNPEVGPDETPFETTLFSGTVVNMGDGIISPEPLPACCPEIEIQTGRGIGVTAIISNPCNETFTDLEWSIDIEGNVFSPPSGGIHGVISSLPPGEEVTIKSGLIIGFGSANITVTVDDCEPESGEATLRFIFVIVK